MEPPWQEHVGFLPPSWMEFVHKLAENGFVLHETTFNYAFFGSRTVVLHQRGRNLWMRLVYDGRDRFWTLDLACAKTTVHPRETWGAAWWAKWAGLTEGDSVEPDASELVAQHFAEILQLTDGFEPEVLMAQVSSALQGI